MATMQITADQIKRCHHVANGYGSESYTWSDVTNDTNTSLYRIDYSDNALYDYHDFLQFRIPATGLDGFNINSVTLYFRATSVNREMGLKLYVEDDDGLESAGGHSSLSDSISAAGWHSKDITSLFNTNTADKDAAWYAQVRIGTVTQEVEYEAYINTLNGDYDPYIVIDYTPDQCGAPTLGALTTPQETDPTLSGTDATGDEYGNEITGYEIQYTESSDGETWGSWTAEKTVTTSNTYFSVTVTIPSTRGYYRKWRVRTIGEAGSTYYSDWVESDAVCRNSAPLAPASATASPAIYESGGISISWQAAADDDDNVTAYELQRATSTDGETWDDWVDVNTSISGVSYVDSPTITRGEYVKYQVRAKDAFGITSSYVETGNVCRNQIPNAATISYPQASQTIYNPRPRLLVTLGAEPDGQTQALEADGYIISHASPYDDGEQLLLQRSIDASAGAVSVTITPEDSQGTEGSSASVSTTYTELSFTDETLTPGETRIKAAHINELRTAIDTIRAYYGMSAYAWAETIKAGTTSMRGWYDHIIELRTAINEIITFVNGWDESALLNIITVPTWVTLDEIPSAAVLNQIRTLLPTL